MGQILSNLWRWLCPMPRNERPKFNHQPNYQTFSHVQQQQQSHFIDISDHHVQPISGSSRNKIIVNHDNNLDPSASHTVVDLKKKKPVLDCGDQVKPEVALDKKVTTTISHVSTNVGRIGPYTSAQRILLVGEGDFSFSACLAFAFGTSAANITATSLNTKKFLTKNYNNFVTNKAKLETRGSTVLHGVNAATMLRHPFLGSMVFDRIIFNFPHALNCDRTYAKPLPHQKLIREFLRNAKEMIGEDGEIHVTSKSNGVFLEWDVPKIGSDLQLNLIQEVKFKRNKYPGYNPKYGCDDEDFNCNPSKTYKFGQLHAAKLAGTTPIIGRVRRATYPLNVWLRTSLVDCLSESYNNYLLLVHYLSIYAVDY